MGGVMSLCSSEVEPEDRIPANWFENRRTSRAPSEHIDYVPPPYHTPLDWVTRSKMPLRVLSIDGGGVRGIIPGLVLDYIERKTGKRIADLFDVLVGTSVGAMLCSALTVPNDAGRPKYTAAECIELCIKNADRLFPSSILRTILTQGGLKDPKYPADGLETVMKEYFGDHSLKDTLRDVVIPCYDIEIRESVFFKSRQARKENAEDYKLWQILRAASASPTYFEPALIPTKRFEHDPDLHMKKNFVCIDSGVYVNSPGMCAFAEVNRHYPDRIKTSQDILLVSLGTGQEEEQYSFEEVRHWGLLQWARPVLDIMTQATSSIVNYQLSQLLDSRQYYRFNTTIPTGKSPFDDTSQANLAYLEQLGLALIEKEKIQLDELCAMLLEQSELEEKCRQQNKQKEATASKQGKGTIRGTYVIHASEKQLLSVPESPDSMKEMKEKVPPTIIPTVVVQDI